MVSVDVIVPVFNGEKYIEKCICSLVNQTYKDLRIICVNDGSTDNTAAMLESLQENISNLIVLNIARGGVSKARNNGIDFSLKTKPKGYISFVDSDDYVEPMFIEELVRTIYSGNDIQLATCGLLREDTKGEILSSANLEKAIISNQNAIVSMEVPYFSGGIDCAIWDKLFDKNLMTDIRLNENLYQYEDAEMLCRYLCKCDKVGVSSKNYYHYVKNDDSYMSNIKMDGKFLSGYYARKLMVETVRNESKQAVTAVNTAFIKRMLTVGQNAVLEEWAEGLDEEKILNELSADARHNFRMIFEVNMSVKLKLLAVMLAISPKLFKMIVVGRYK